MYEDYGRKKYLIEMVICGIIQQRLSNSEIDAIEILYEDLESFFRKDDEK